MKKICTSFLPCPTSLVASSTNSQLRYAYSKAVKLSNKILPFNRNILYFQHCLCRFLLCKV